MKYVFFLVFLMGVGYSCNYNTDCDPSQKCIKQSFSIEGVCAEVRNNYGGSYISNESKKNNQCSSNFECEYPAKCIKMNGSYTGICMVQR